MPKPPSNRIDQEGPLVQYARRLERRTDGFQALHLHMSKLLARNRPASLLRVAENALRRLVTTYDDQIFHLTNDDLVVVCHGKDRDLIFDALERVQGLVRHDPLFTDPGADSGAFATWNDFSETWHDFMARIELLVEELQARKAAAEVVEIQFDPMDVTNLATMESNLRSVDITNFIRRQPICAVSGKNPPAPVFDELYVSVSDLQKAIMPEVDLAANRVLFQQLTSIFDSRMLSALRTHGASYLAGPVSLNLNVATMLAPEFLEFVNHVISGHDQVLVVELHLSDVFGNLKNYLLARDMAREFGCRLCLDGIDHAGLPLLDFAGLGFHLYKLRWEQEIDELPKPALEQLRAAVARAGAERMILCRCDDARALNFGRGLGIGLFQGWHLDKALKALRRPKPAVAASRG